MSDKNSTSPADAALTWRTTMAGQQIRLTLGEGSSLVEVSQDDGPFESAPQVVALNMVAIRLSRVMHALDSLHRAWPPSPPTGSTDEILQAATAHDVWRDEVARILSGEDLS